MALDPVVKVEITAHNSVMDDVIEKLQEEALVQIDPHSMSGWSNPFVSTSQLHRTRISPSR